MLKHLYIAKRFFYIWGLVLVLYVVSFVVPIVFYLAHLSLIVLILLLLVDSYLALKMKTPFKVDRNLPNRLNLGDEVIVEITITNTTKQSHTITLIDQAPVEFQVRDSVFSRTLFLESESLISYNLTPKRRGEYKWGDITVYCNSPFGLVRRKFCFNTAQQVPVYPSVEQMKKYEFQVFSKKTFSSGIKRIPLLGHNNEFEQINNYVQGDEIKRINWKATSRKRELMVNHYQAERSQSIYMVIDKSRAMERSFDGLSLLDYAINASLAFGNVALRKGEKVGVVTFSDKMGDKLVASKGKGQLKAILDLLYNQRTNFKEANVKLLTQNIQRDIRSRSLLMMFTNFETLMSLKRALPMLKLINRQHVLMVVFFENTQLSELANKRPEKVEDVYSSTIAQNQMHIKHEMAKLLKANGIYAILSQPNDLSMNTINAYLSVKARGVI